MEFDAFLKKVSKLAVIEAEALYSGEANRASIEVQLSRWHKSGKLIQLKRGLYVLSEIYRKVDIYGPAVAAVLHRPSYLSLEKALEFHNLIPEQVAVYTSVTSNRPAIFKTGIGDFKYTHIQTNFFWGYSAATLNNQTAFVALPEKALLDFFYLRHGPVTEAYIDELRLQNLEDLDERRLIQFAKNINKPKLFRVAEHLKRRIIAQKRYGEKEMKDHCLALVAAKSGYNEKLNAMREYLQAYILSFMYEGGVFRHAAFVGGTALRFLHGLPRFSEDLDFSQAGKDKVNFSALMNKIMRELVLAGYSAAVSVSEDKTVNSAFIKFEGLMHEAGISPLKSQKFSVKIEIDTNPPQGAVLEELLVNKYFPINFLAYNPASLFAGKVHAILSRKYTKGRDLFDLGWYLMTWKGIEPNFTQLNNALVQSKWQGPVISKVNWRGVVSEAVAKADWKKMRSDVAQFLERPRDIELLSQEAVLKMLS